MNAQLLAGMLVSMALVASCATTQSRSTAAASKAPSVVVTGEVPFDPQAVIDGVPVSQAGKPATGKKPQASPKVISP